MLAKFSIASSRPRAGTRVEFLTTVVYNQLGGVFMGKVVDLTGARFGLWTVLGRSGSNASGQATWLCKCVCGTELILTLPTAKAGGFSVQIPMPKGRGFTPRLVILN